MLTCVTTEITIMCSPLTRYIYLFVNICLLRSNDINYVQMLDDRGNTAVYMLYAYTRIRYSNISTK